MRLLIILLLFVSLSSCFNIKTGDPIEGIGPGTWQGSFLLEDQVVPVMFDILNADNDKPLELVFKTANQSLKADATRVFGDTLFAEFHKANTLLKVVYQVDQMDGFLYDNDEVEYPIVFAGQYNIKHRFPNIRKKPLVDLTGEWKLTASVDNDSTLNGNVRFVAQGNYLEGTLQLDQHKSILLEGTVQGNKLLLSGFDGKTVCLLSATITDSKSLTQGSLKWNNKGFYWEGEIAAGVMH